MTLTEAAISIKKGFRYFLLGIVGLAVLWFLALLLMALFNSVAPLFEKPDVKFGSLPKPNLTAGNYKSINFSIDTVDGKLPSFPRILPVYKFVIPAPSLLDVDNSKKLADSFGFSEGPSIIDKTNYRYVSHLSPAQNFQINIISKNFSLGANLADPSITKGGLSDSTDAIATKAREILSQHALLKDDLKKSDVLVTNVKLVNGSLVGANSISDANFTKVDIFRSSLNGYSIVSPKPHQSLVNMLFSTNQQSSNVLDSLNYTYWAYDKSAKATYSLLTPTAAYQALQNGQATLVLPDTQSFSEVSIKKVGIVYFEDLTFQLYLQPIVLFEGVANAQNGSEIEVRFYLPAVDPTYLAK